MRWAVAAGAANALRPGQGAIDPSDVARIQSLVSLTHLPAGGA
jgi:fructose-1-phosphate kinase PfkB-like protein